MMHLHSSTSAKRALPTRSLPVLPASLTHLRHERRWVLWKYSSQLNGKGKRRKAPFSPHAQPSATKPGQHTYKGAKTDDAATWGTFDECLAALQDWRGWFNGIGLVLLPGEVGIDFDDCYAEDGTLRADVAQLVQLAAGRAYIERSVSGNGVHIITLGRAPAAIKTNAGEVYDGRIGRYFTLSGDELAGSATPAPGQPVIDAAIAQITPQPVASDTTYLSPLLTLALTPELADAIHDAQQRLPALLADLEHTRTPQLRDLLEHGVFPLAMTDTSASGARAVIVCQLQRAKTPTGRYRNYSDAEVVVMSRHLWQLQGYEGAMHGDTKRLNADAYRLIAQYRPHRKGAQVTAPVPKRTYQAAPAPIAYIQRLADARIGDAIPHNRTERAKLAGVSLITAKRIEEQLQTAGLATTETYSRRGHGTKGRSSLLRFTPAGLAALRNEPVILRTNADAPQDEPVANSAAGREIRTIPESKNTGVCNPTLLTHAPQPATPATPSPVATRSAHRRSTSPSHPRVLPATPVVRPLAGQGVAPRGANAGELTLVDTAPAEPGASYDPAADHTARRRGTRHGTVTLQRLDQHAKLRARWEARYTQAGGGASGLAALQGERNKLRNTARQRSGAQAKALQAQADELQQLITRYQGAALLAFFHPASLPSAPPVVSPVGSAAPAVRAANGQRTPEQDKAASIHPRLLPKWRAAALAGDLDWIAQRCEDELDVAKVAAAVLALEPPNDQMALTG